MEPICWGATDGTGKGGRSGRGEAVGAETAPVTYAGVRGTTGVTNEEKAEGDGGAWLTITEPVDLREPCAGRSTGEEYVSTGRERELPPVACEEREEIRLQFEHLLGDLLQCECEGAREQLLTEGIHNK